jgi:hypothetical protein
MSQDETRQNVQDQTRLCEESIAFSTDYITRGVMPWTKKDEAFMKFHSDMKAYKIKQKNNRPQPRVQNAKTLAKYLANMTRTHRP